MGNGASISCGKFFSRLLSFVVVLGARLCRCIHSVLFRLCSQACAAVMEKKVDWVTLTTALVSFSNVPFVTAMCTAAANLVAAMEEDRSPPVAAGMAEAMIAVLRAQNDPACVTASARCLALLMEVPEARSRVVNSGKPRVLYAMTSHVLRGRR